MSVISIPAPVGGINARDSYAAMPISDAVFMQDMVPATNYCETAPPCTAYMAAPPGRTHSLIPYEASGTNRLLAVFESGVGSWDIVNITNPLSTTTLKSAQAEGVYVWTMFQSNLILCNGQNTPQVYNGTTMINLVATGPTITKFRGCITFKGRVYYWDDESQTFHYAAAGAYQGSLSSFPVDTLTTKGGKITLLTTFTRDGGEGADDLFVIVMDTGEILVYQGDDPASSTAWELVGKFQMPRPVGVRSVLRVGGNTLLLTYEGVCDLGRILSGSPYPLVSDKARKLLVFQPTLSATYNDLISLIDFPEAESVMCNEMGQSDLNRWVVTEGIMAVTKTSGSWWSYAGSSTADFDAQELTCSCVWLGKTYFGFNSAAIPIFTPTDESGNYHDEVVSGPWYPIGMMGYSFSVSNASTVIKNYSPVSLSGEVGFSAYVTPFGGLLGNATMIQVITGTITGFWSGRDKKRWISTNLRIKAGGKR